MTVYPWPDDFPVSYFELRVTSNQRIFTGPYTPAVQVLDLFGERWSATITMPPAADRRAGARREAFFGRLRGSANGISLGHLQNRAPLGSLRGPFLQTWRTSTGVTQTWHTSSSVVQAWGVLAPVVSADIAQFATTGTLHATPFMTLYAGDLVGLGGQLVQIMADAQADVSGAMSIEFYPRARTRIVAGSAVEWDAPTANFILKPGSSGVPTPWTPGVVEGCSLELIEVY